MQFHRYFFVEKSLKRFTCYDKRHEMKTQTVLFDDVSCLAATNDLTSFISKFDIRCTSNYEAAEYAAESAGWDLRARVARQN